MHLIIDTDVRLIIDANIHLIIDTDVRLIIDTDVRLIIDTDVRLINDTDVRLYLRALFSMTLMDVCIYIITQIFYPNRWYLLFFLFFQSINSRMNVHRPELSYSWFDSFLYI
jgi:hypothetical protein